MNPLNKKGDQFNPDIILDQRTGQLSIKGKSIPLNTDTFLTDVIQWIEQYSSDPSEATSLEIDLKYMNGSSIRTLLSILHRMKTISDSGKYVKVQWNIPSDAEDLHELSQHLMKDLNIPHNISLN